MVQDLRDFWHRFQTGVEVAVAGESPDLLLGVRDGFLRFFHDGLDRPVAVAVVPQEVGDETRGGLPLSDAEGLRCARTRALALQERLRGDYHFYVGSEGSLHELETDGRRSYFVHNWTVILGGPGEACGSSGSVQLPDRLVEGLGGDQIPFAVPGTRRSGGMISSLTGGLETRRSAVATATLHALSSLFYGILESYPVRRR
jgi:non-canonical (house-cleaning) NTP pyrophosphatase